MAINFKVNGKDYSVDREMEDTSLLLYLRNTLRLTSVKNGCNEGHCGTCTVIINGKAKKSCLVKLKTLAGAEIETLEALSSREAIHPVIYAYVMEGAVQCGFCTPGFIMATKALLQNNPSPSPEEVKKALSGNLCRCTGYVKILKAVERAADLLRQGRTWIPRGEIYPEAVEGLGNPVPRIDALKKATGELLFAEDLFFEGMLYAKVLRSAHPHAEILRIDASAASRLPGVAAVLTAKDPPGRNRFGPILQDQEVFAEKRVRYLGDALAAVYAETEETAETALSLINVEYSPLPAVSSFDDLEKEDPVLLHEREDKSNIFSTMESGRGDPETGFLEADYVLEGVYTTQYIEHAYLEPESCVAVFDAQGKLTVYVGSQGPEADIKELAPVLGIPPEKIRIAHMPMGGGFGGKEDISVQIIAALGAQKTGKPVKYTFTRRESIRTSGKRNSQRLVYKTGVKRDGTLVAVQGDITARAGAYASVEEAVILRSVSFAAGPYAVPHASFKARAYYCNNMPACAMRGFGNPSVTFAAETQLNRIAETLGIDPIEIREKNALTVGKVSITGEKIPYSVGILECLKAVREALGRTVLPPPRPGWRRGTGIAASYKNVGLGIGMDDSAGAYCELLPDGNLLLRIGSVDMGQGANTIMAQILSETLGWPYSRIVVHSADSEEDPRAGMTTASRQTFVTGNAVLQMAVELKAKLISLLCREYQVTPSKVAITRDGLSITLPGPEKEQILISYPDFGRVMKERGITLSAETRYTAPKTVFNLKESLEKYPKGEGRLHAAYCFGAQAVILEVEEATGKVEVLKVIAAHDTGKTINRHGAEGQVEGGVVMGLGFALSEEFRIKEGIIISDTLGKLGLRKIGQTPEIETILVEDPHPEGPYGAKGMGELPISPIAPAVVHAIYKALGVWITDLPAIPEKILEGVTKLVKNRK